MMQDPKIQIGELVQADLLILSGHLRAWVDTHLVDPRQEIFSADPDGTKLVNLWLVTDNTGHEDSSSRVVFDPKEEKFGLVMGLKDGTYWFMGLYGSFADTIISM